MEVRQCLGVRISKKGLSAYKSGDFATALREWTPIAKQGNGFVQFNLGLMHDNGRGVLQDYKTAVNSYNLAAEQGDAYGQYILRAMYVLGAGLIQDNVYAHMWGNLSASNGNENGAKLRDLAATQMTPSQLEKAQDIARECARKNYKGC